MAQPLQTSASRYGSTINSAVFDHTVRLLDQAIPLDGVSHAEVVEYCVEIPMRYAECVAKLADGRKVGLKDPSCFAGWSSHEPRRSLLFISGDSHLEVEVGRGPATQAPGNIRNVSFLEAARRQLTAVRKFIGIDGELVLIPAVG
ncbi:MAG: hypothetical protein QNJ07_08875 [Woeseiaceae bacterium]|nr:hypothetical protein [Woeseiaceae bacterium]